MTPETAAKMGATSLGRWTAQGLLATSGTGEMADYESKTDSASGEEITTAPWGNQAKTVVIGDGVTGIGAAAFYGCSGLTSVTMGSNVTSIGESAFCGCTGLTGIVLPGSVTSIGEYAFSNCESLTAIEIPEGVTTLGNSAFFGCDNLKEVRYNARGGSESDWLERCIPQCRSLRGRGEGDIRRKRGEDPQQPFLQL